MGAMKTCRWLSFTKMVWTDGRVMSAHHLLGRNNAVRHLSCKSQIYSITLICKIAKQVGVAVMEVT